MKKLFVTMLAGLAFSAPLLAQNTIATIPVGASPIALPV